MAAAACAARSARSLSRFPRCPCSGALGLESSCDSLVGALVVAGFSLARAPPPPLCAERIAAMRSFFRSFEMPLTPSLLASCCSSATRIALSDPVEPLDAAALLDFVACCVSGTNDPSLVSGLLFFLCNTALIDDPVFLTGDEKTSHSLGLSTVLFALQ